MKVFFDIGTNEFQGYNELSKRLGIDSTWKKVFLEPNPNIYNSEDWIAKLESIENSEFFDAALCCNCEEKTADLMFTPNMKDRDMAASISNESIRNIESTKKIKVDVIDFDDISKKYKNDEWYIKLDCELCEYYCLEDIIRNHHNNIKRIWCEFHVHDSVGVPSWEKKKKELLDLGKEYNINIEDWH